MAARVAKYNVKGSGGGREAGGKKIKKRMEKRKAEEKRWPIWALVWAERAAAASASALMRSSDRMSR